MHFSIEYRAGVECIKQNFFISLSVNWETGNAWTVSESCCSRVWERETISGWDSWDWDWGCQGWACQTPESHWDEDKGDEQSQEAG